MGKLKTEFTSPIAKSTSPGYRSLLSLHAERGREKYVHSFIWNLMIFLELVKYLCAGNWLKQICHFSIQHSWTLCLFQGIL